MVPVGHAVTDKEALQIYFLLSIFVVIMDLIGHIWNIDSTVGFSGDVQSILLELWELLEPAQ